MQNIRLLSGGAACPSSIIRLCRARPHGRLGEEGRRRGSCGASRGAPLCRDGCGDFGDAPGRGRIHSLLEGSRRSHARYGLIKGKNDDGTEKNHSRL